MRNAAIIVACLLVGVACGTDPADGAGVSDSSDSRDRDRRDRSESADERRLASACLELIGTDPLRLGPVAPDISVSASVRLVNCGSATLLVDSVDLLEHATLPGLDRFELAGPAPGGVSTSLATGDELEITLAYSSDAVGEVNGASLVVRAFDADDRLAEVTLPVLGLAQAELDCADLVAEARALGGAGPWQAHLDVGPLTRVELRARAQDEDVPVRWEFLARPEGSTRILEASDDNRPALFTDLVGGYALRGIADDEGGGCLSAPLTLSAEPTLPIYVELVWDTAGDPDGAAGAGSDVDLHFLDPRGRWDESPWDCFWRNHRPEWVASEPQQNPVLDIDDVDGWGPEVISAFDLEGTAQDPRTYRIGAHYFSDHGFGDSTVTVRVFIDGRLRLVESRVVANRQFWEVGAITWPTGEVSLTNVLHVSGFPSE